MPKWEEEEEKWHRRMNRWYLGRRHRCNGRNISYTAWSLKRTSTKLMVHFLVALDECQRWSSEDEGIGWTDGPLVGTVGLSGGSLVQESKSLSQRLLTVYFGTPNMFITLWFGLDYETNPPLRTTNDITSLSSYVHLEVLCFCRKTWT
jgi:hypothetical protein